jgi:hypothetical protein
MVVGEWLLGSLFLVPLSALTFGVSSYLSFFWAL